MQKSNQKTISEAETTFDVVFDVLDSVLLKQIRDGVLTDNQRLLIYLDFSHEVKARLEAKKRIAEYKKRIEEIANYRKPTTV